MDFSSHSLYNRFDTAALTKNASKIKGGTMTLADYFETAKGVGVLPRRIKTAKSTPPSTAAPT
jgi:hypothetical protein